MEARIKHRLVTLTQDLIRMPTSCAHPNAIEKCIHYIKEYVEQSEGISVELYDHEGVASLSAFPTGVEAPDILFCAHLDVIPLDHHVHYTSHIENGRIYGPGAADMKGALAILLESFRDTHAHIPGASLGLLVTSDEERGGEYGVQYLFSEKGMRCGAAIIPDSGSLNRITVEEKGLLHFTLRRKGLAGHACRPWLCDNALEKLVDGVARLNTYFHERWNIKEDHWCPTFSITIIRTENEATNRIPEFAEAVCDIRFTPPHTGKEMIEIVQSQLGNELEMQPVMSAEPSSFSPDPLFLSITEDITGKPVHLIKEDGASDARFISALGIPAIMSRPTVGNVHSEHEWIDIDSMKTLFDIYKEYLTQRFNG